MSAILPIPPTQDLSIGRTVQPIAAGQAAWARLNHFENWRDWKAVGEAVAIGRAEALAQVSTKKPVGRRYNTAFHDWLERYGFAGISKSTRARLLECMANIEAIEAWRASLSPDDLLKFNHPGVVLREWRKAAAKSDSNFESDDDTKSDGDDPPAPTIAEIKRLIERLASADHKALIGEVLHKHPDLIPRDLREQLLRQHHRRDSVAYARIAKRAREIVALSHHAEHHVDAIRKAAAEILNAVEPKVMKPIAVAAVPVGDLSAWPKAMGLPAEGTSMGGRHQTGHRDPSLNLAAPRGRPAASSPRRSRRCPNTNCSSSASTPPRTSMCSTNTRRPESPFGSSTG